MYGMYAIMCCVHYNLYAYLKTEVCISVIFSGFDFHELTFASVFAFTHAACTDESNQDDEEGSPEVPPARSDDEYVQHDDSASNDFASNSGTACVACMRSCVCVRCNLYAYANDTDAANTIAQQLHFLARADVGMNV